LHFNFGIQSKCLHPDSISYRLTLGSETVEVEPIDEAMGRVPGGMKNQLLINHSIELLNSIPLRFNPIQMTKEPRDGVRTHESTVGPVIIF
jgi:hypothetical protein